MFNIFMTETASLLAIRMRKEIREFRKAQYGKVREATILVQRVAKERGRSSGLKRRTGKGLWFLRRRVRRARPGVYTGKVYFTRDGFYMRILQERSVVKRGLKVVGHRPGFPFMRQAYEATIAEVERILGEAYRVFIS